MVPGDAFEPGPEPEDDAQTLGGSSERTQLDGGSETAAAQATSRPPKTEMMRLPWVAQTPPPRSSATTRWRLPLPPLLLLLLLCGGDTAGAQQSVATDIAALLAFKGSSVADDWITATWTAGTSPCGDGWDGGMDGWIGVGCCANGAFVCSGMFEASTNAGRVKSIVMANRREFRGDLAALAALTELEYLNLLNTNVHGDIAGLLVLTLLTTLNLGNTRAYGDAVAIRATVPGLSAWGTAASIWGGQYDYDACSAYATCPAGAGSITGGDDAVGSDECACCDGSGMVREPATGGYWGVPGACVCTNNVACGLPRICSLGSCVDPPGALFLRAAESLPPPPPHPPTHSCISCCS